MKRFVCGVIFVVLGIGDICSFSQPGKVKLNPNNATANKNFTDKEIIERVENSLRNLKLKTKIVQISPRGKQTTGFCMIHRKKGWAKLSMDKMVVVVRDGRVTQYDLELKEKTESTANSSPLSFLLERRLDLENNVVLMGIQNEPRELRVRFARNNPEAEGNVELIFSQHPFLLKGWVVYSNEDDHCGTQILFVEPKFDVDITEEDLRRISRS